MSSRHRMASLTCGTRSRMTSTSHADHAIRQRIAQAEPAMGAWHSGDRRDRRAALGQVSRSVSVTCAVSDRWSAKILNERGGHPLRPAASARTRPVAGIVAQPGRRQRPRPGLRPKAVARLRSADLPLCGSQHLRLSHRAQYRSDAFARWSSACARFGKKQTFWNASDAASQSLATVGAREPPIWRDGRKAILSTGRYADRAL
jgi:hypothetical protein